MDQGFRHITISLTPALLVGFGLALVLFAGLRERFALSRMPKPLQGTVSGLITAGLMALAFQGFLKLGEG